MWYTVIGGSGGGPNRDLSFSKGFIALQQHVQAQGHMEGDWSMPWFPWTCMHDANQKCISEGLTWDHPSMPPLKPMGPCVPKTRHWGQAWNSLTAELPGLACACGCECCGMHDYASSFSDQLLLSLCNGSTVLSIFTSWWALSHGTGLLTRIGVKKRIKKSASHWGNISDLHLG